MLYRGQVTGLSCDRTRKSACAPACVTAHACNEPIMMLQIGGGRLHARSSLPRGPPLFAPALFIFDCITPSKLTRSTTQQQPAAAPRRGLAMRTCTCSAHTQHHHWSSAHRIGPCSALTVTRLRQQAARETPRLCHMQAGSSSSQVSRHRRSPPVRPQQTASARAPAPVCSSAMAWPARPAGRSTPCGRQARRTSGAQQHTKHA